MFVSKFLGKRQGTDSKQWGKIAWCMFFQIRFLSPSFPSQADKTNFMRELRNREVSSVGTERTKCYRKEELDNQGSKLESFEIIRVQDL